MDGVLEGAAVLCVCKLAFSLLCLPSLAALHSPISFCCSCLLLFTDFVVTGEYQDAGVCAGHRSFASAHSPGPSSTRVTCRVHAFVNNMSHVES